MLINYIEKESKSWFLWLPIFIAFGIGIRFKLEFWYVISPLIFCLCRRKSICIIALIISLEMILGFIAASYRINSIASPVIDTKIGPITITGTLEQFEKKDNLIRLYLRDIDGINISKARLTVRSHIKDKLYIGDRISLKAVLMPPSLPSYPNSFDFARFVYFKQIGAIGYGTSSVKVISREGKDLSFLDQINNLRKIIANRIYKVIPKQEGTIVAGLLVGESKEIEEKDYNAMRIAGTAHLVAISGMHIAVVAGIAFIFAKLLLLCFKRFTTKLHLKRIAAVMAILFSFFYLVITGMPVSAQRAFITSSIFFISIIFYRDTDALYSLATAAVIILIIIPEALFSPSLQMSFAACIALITTFRATNNIFKNKNKSLICKSIFYIFNLILASATASIATAPFIIYHFNQFSFLGILANLICVPLNDFFIMPLGIIGLILMPLQLERWPLKLMEYGINVMLNVSHYIASLPNASMYFPSFSNSSIVIIAISIIIICIGRSKWLKYLSIIVTIGICCANTLCYDIPDIIVSESGLFAVRGSIISKENHKNELILSSLKSNRYNRNIWKQALGQNNFSNKAINKHNINNCNSEICIAENIVILNTSSYWYCKPVELFINISDDRVCNEAKYNITLYELYKYGTHTVKIKDNIIVEKVSDFININAPWYKGHFKQLIID